MGEQSAKVIIGLVIAAVVYFVKSYFDGIKSDIKSVSKEVSELRGSFDPLRKDIKDNTVALATAEANLSALWRFVDAPKRKSDASTSNKNGDGNPY